MKRPKRVLFVCIGNSCRSQMAEAFARAHGIGVIDPCSAGLYPAIIVAPDTLKAMAEKNLDLKGQFPKSIDQMDLSKFDLIIDMSGGMMDGIENPPVETLDVPDPIRMEYAQHRQVRDQIEVLVKGLIRELGARQKNVGAFGLSR